VRGQLQRPSELPPKWQWNVRDSSPLTTFCEYENIVVQFSTDLFWQSTEKKAFSIHQNDRRKARGEMKVKGAWDVNSPQIHPKILSWNSSEWSSTQSVNSFWDYEDSSSSTTKSFRTFTTFPLAFTQPHQSIPFFMFSTWNLKTTKSFGRWNWPSSVCHYSTLFRFLFHQNRKTPRRNALKRWKIL
jgi:hypothetical protein